MDIGGRSVISIEMGFRKRMMMEALISGGKTLRKVNLRV